MPGFRWTPAKEKAALLLSQDDKTETVIAEEVGVSRAAMHKWKCHPDFKARVQEHIDAFRQIVRSRGIAIMERRIAAMQRRWDKLHQVIEERAADPELQDIPGGKTGLIAKSVKSAGGELIDVYEVDTGLLSELRAHEKQVAQELGQWSENVKTSVTVNTGNAVAVDASDSATEVAAIIASRTADVAAAGEVLDAAPPRDS